MVAMLGMGPGFGVPLVVLVAVVFAAGKALGLAVLGGALGGLILRRLRWRPLTVDVFLGVALLLLLRLLPVVGGVVWTVASLAALGAAATTLALAPPLASRHAADSS
jgi:hypothetical protein